MTDCNFVCHDLCILWVNMAVLFLSYLSNSRLRIIVNGYLVVLHNFQYYNQNPWPWKHIHRHYFWVDQNKNNNFMSIFSFRSNGCPFELSITLDWTSKQWKMMIQHKFSISQWNNFEFELKWWMEMSILSNIQKFWPTFFHVRVLQKKCNYFDQP